jgi:hypothetical protein
MSTPKNQPQPPIPQPPRRTHIITQQPAPTYGPPRPPPQQLLPIHIPLATPSTTSTASATIDPISCPLTDEDVRKALLEWFSRDCCFDQRPARRMKINVIIPMHAYRYILEVFIIPQLLIYFYLLKYLSLLDFYRSEKYQNSKHSLRRAPSSSSKSSPCKMVCSS